MNKNSKIFVAGHRGLVGSAIVRRLEKEGFTNLVLKTRSEVDLTRQAEVETFFESERPEFVFLSAAKVGGIHANNTYPAEFIYQNMMIQNNVINSAHKITVKKLLFLGSSCIYPKFAPQPMKEDHLLTGELEPTNEAYAIAKISGMKMAEFYNKQYGANFISAMPTNLYGPGDNYDLQNSHVLPALIRKFHEAKEENKPFVEIWGTGKPKREFLFVDDLAEACIFLMQNYNDIGFVNVGTGEDVSIKELVSIVREIVGYQGELKYNTDKPDGTPRKLMDVSKINKLGWVAKTNLREGIEKTYLNYKKL
ncbi:MAG: GDP-L-fucose synthase [Calditrichaeota bacterium]|nr:MAG: GDP-L-fucose synthase [Calditrichota bacterium]MBL1204592.1 GDP-L-fucose synthase [Calditrichota bacterium]NOG44421.1 GDP-L-fucose synthase [Calditrichota bacterium]